MIYSGTENPKVGIQWFCSTKRVTWEGKKNYKLKKIASSGKILSSAPSSIAPMTSSNRSSDKLMSWKKEYSAECKNMIVESKPSKDKNRKANPLLPLDNKTLRARRALTLKVHQSRQTRTTVLDNQDWFSRIYLLCWLKYQQTKSKLNSKKYKVWISR